MITVPRFIDTKTIIVNLLKEDKQRFLSVSRLNELLDFIYIKLLESNKLDKYQITFDINYNALARTIIYSGNIFALDFDNSKIYVKEAYSFEKIADENLLDPTILGFVQEFAEKEKVAESSCV